MLVLSWVAACVACLAYGVGSILQSIGARRTAHVAGVSGVALIALQLPYLLGLSADALAFLANIVALQRLPLFLVQTIMTASVGVTAVIASILGEGLSRRGWWSLGILGTGLALLGATASAESAVRVSSLSEWLILASAVVPVAVGAAGLRLARGQSAPVLAGAAGLAWTAVAVASRGIGAEPVGWALLADPLLWTIVLQGVLGAVFFALALQRGSVTGVTAITFMIEMVAPSALGLWLFDDAVGPGLAPLAVFGFVLALVGTGSLIRATG